VKSAEQQVVDEAELARSLAEASEKERPTMYGPVYDRIYEMHLESRPDQLEFGASPRLIPFLLKLTKPDDRVMEVGCGGGLLAIALARAGRSVVGIDVASVILHIARDRAAGTENIEFVKVDGLELPAKANSVDFAYSVEVLEHLHPDDVPKHLLELHRALRPGGQCWILTPNAIAESSASDRFGVDVEVDADVHLKEWTYAELGSALARAGFTELRSPWHHRIGALLPLGVYARLETLPRWVLRSRLARLALGVDSCSVVATAS
jgi:2-polyprenyl-3-methyl-5-hydroxy-6-metoxy-1,4-benzoquinol methylase